MNHRFLKIVFTFLLTILSLNISAQRFQAYAYKASHNSQWTKCNRTIEIRNDFDNIILEVYWTEFGGTKYFLSKKLKEGEDYKYFFGAPFSNLSAKQKVSVIKALSKGWVGGRMNVGSEWGEEDVILEVLHATPSIQYKEVIDGLYKEKLLFNLVHGVDDLGCVQFPRGKNDFPDPVHPDHLLQL